MQLDERSYGGQLFRPRPEIFISDDKQLMIIATPWGPRTMAQRFIEKINNELQDLTVDPDRTVFSVPVDTLSDYENRLRLALLTTHEDLREEFNYETLNAGLEILCVLKSEKKISWFQVGAPFLAVVRGDKMLPFHHPLDLSFDHSTDSTLPPLPRELYGLSQQLSLVHGGFMYQPQDRLLLIARSYVPHQLFASRGSEIELEPTTSLLAKENSELPFWIGIVGI